MSYLGNFPSSTDLFLRIPSEKVQQPYIGYATGEKKDGYVYLHGHPLNGTKFFTWGEVGVYKSVYKNR